MRSMGATYLLAMVLLLALAVPSRGVQLDEHMDDVAQKNEEKVPVLVDRTSTLIRNPRIFFPLTTSTKTATTTGSVTLCMVTSTTLIACKRKRRMVLMDGEEDAEVSRIQPSLVESAPDGVEDEEEEEFADIQGDLSELSRNPRFMVYWTTIVSTSYTTTYMQTSLIATLACTPSGFTLASSGCGR